MLPTSGTVVADKYRVEVLLGEGGMGAVFRARHELMDKPVALKWLKPGLRDDKIARQRFMQEARAAARIRHPNVVDVYDVGEQDGALFMVMELLEGETLASYFDNPLCTPSQVLRHIIGAMRGVSAAHAVGITHRDIKPENVFIAFDPVHTEGIAKILDFGISKLQGETATHLTGPGMAMGTPHYMSVEQLCGEPLDARTDIYSFGVLLYRALTGRMPYDGELVGQIVAQALAGVARRPLELVPSLPRELDRIVMRAMARNRDDRFQSMKELIDALNKVQWLSEPSSPSIVPSATPVSTPRSTRTRPQQMRPAFELVASLPPASRGTSRKIYLAAAALFGLTFAGVMYWDRAEEAPVTKAAVPSLPEVMPTVAVQPTIVPDAAVVGSNDFEVVDEAPAPALPVSAPVAAPPAPRVVLKKPVLNKPPIVSKPVVEAAPVVVAPAPAKVEPEALRHRSGALRKEDL